MEYICVINVLYNNYNMVLLNKYNHYFLKLLHDIYYKGPLQQLKYDQYKQYILKFLYDICLCIKWPLQQLKYNL